jgi:hypothetical protein
MPSYLPYSVSLLSEDAPSFFLSENFTSTQDMFLFFLILFLFCILRTQENNLEGEGPPIETREWEKPS